MAGHRLRAISQGLTLALGVLAFGSNARAGLFSDDEARRAIVDLRRADEAQQAKYAELNDRIDQLRRSMLELNSQIEQLRAEMAQQRGQTELLARDVAETQRKQKDLAQGVEARVAKLEPQQVTVDGKTVTVDPEEKRAFDDALAVLRQGDFEAAATALQSLLRRYPGTGLRESTLYWLGNAQYGLRQYREAIASFRSLIAAAPQHARAPEAMLSIANCQVETKEQKAARRTLEDLVKTYPASEAAQAARERLAKLR